jgi:hypothetical protein
MTMEENKEDIANQFKKNITTDEAYEYTRKKLTNILNNLILKSNSDEILRFDYGSILLNYRDSILDEIERVLNDNKITLDESVAIRGAKKYKYYKERLRLIFNRLISRLNEHTEFDDERFDEYVSLINSYIYQVGLDYDLDLVTFDLDSE